LIGAGFKRAEGLARDTRAAREFYLGEAAGFTRAAQ
jgi:hypothetical protein